MRNLTKFVLLFSSVLANADEFFRFDPQEYSFRKNYPVFGFEISPEKSSIKQIIFCTGVQEKTTGKVSVGVALAADVDQKVTVNSFGEDEKAYLRLAVLDGYSSLQRPKIATNQQLTLKGKVWNMSDRAKALVALLDPADESKGKRFICKLELKPLERIYEKDVPIKNLFCKPIKSTVVQMMELDGSLSYGENRQPVMIETVVCPTPENCIKPEWEIVPSIRFIPGVDDSTVHADTATSAVVHTGTRPAAK